MSHQSKWMRWAVPPVMAVVAACGRDGSAEPANAALEQPGARVINVQVQAVAPRPFTEYVNLTGAVAADRDVTVAAEESGVVREVYVDKGAPVRAGQPIARIDDRILRAQAEQASAQAELARETWQRQKRLWEQDSIGSEMTYIQARQAYLTAEANAKALAGRLERTTVRAPIGGRIEDRMIEVGAMVAPGASVARIVDLEPIKVVSGLPERYATDIRAGARAEIGVPSRPEASFVGRVSFVGAAVDPQSRTVPLEIAVPRASTVLRPGMVAEIRVMRAELPVALVVPQGAIQRSEQGYYVYVVERRDDTDVAVARPILIGESQEGLVPVDSGLTAGDRVVVVGQKQVSAGDRVNVVAAEGPKDE